MMTEQKPLHIVHLVWHFSTGGLENGVVNLVNQLPETEFQHTIVSLTGHDPEFVKRIHRANVRLYSLDKKPGHDWGTFKRLNQLLKKLQPDVLHSRNLATLELQIVGWWRKVPLRIHGEHGWDANDIGGTNVKNRLIKRLLKGFVQRFVCLSSESEQYLTKYIKVSPSHIQRICNGVDIQRFSSNEAITADLNHSATIARPVRFATVGRLASVKNQALLVDAFALLLARNQAQAASAQLMLVGDGPLRTSLESQVQRLALQDRVIFTGNRSDIATLMHTFDVFILPSLAEGISNTFLEAMAAGVPVIATAVGGNVDLMPDALKHRNLIPSGDTEALMLAMQGYLNSPELRQQDAGLVKKHCAEHFSIDSMVNRYRTLYQTTLFKTTRTHA